MEVSYILLLCFVSSVTINQVNTLRCADNCKFDTVPVGSLNPFKIPCNTVDIDVTTTVCTVNLTINFGTHFVEGLLQIQPRSVRKLPTLDTKFSLDSTKTIASITYSCVSNDDCDQEFVREAIGSPKWLDIHEIVVRLEINLLLFKADSSPTDLLCANDLVCSSNEKCYSQFTEKRSGSQTSTTSFKAGAVCDTTIIPSVRFDRQFNTPTDDEIMTMDIRCNKDYCNNEKTVLEVYNIIQNEFTFPLNYSSFAPPTNSSHKTKHTFHISSLFLFLSIFLTVLE